LFPVVRLGIFLQNTIALASGRGSIQVAIGRLCNTMPPHDIKKVMISADFYDVFIKGSYFSFQGFITDFAGYRVSHRQGY